MSKLERDVSTPAPLRTRSPSSRCLGAPVLLGRGWLLREASSASALKMITCSDSLSAMATPVLLCMDDVGDGRSG